MNTTLLDAPRHCHVLVIGGGSSGCVVASRLSEDPDCRVTLLEAGSREPADAAMASAMANGHQPAVVAGLNWKYRTAIKGEDPEAARAGSAASIFDYEAGRVLGGSSAVNATQALRGTPADHAAWAEDCGAAWSWDGVLPWFRRLEDDPLGPSALHGRGGPMPIRREAESALAPLHAAFLHAAQRNGFARIADHNDPLTPGAGVIPRNVVDGVRISAAQAYLAPAMQRPNLAVVCGVHVHRLLWRADGRCIGAQGDIGGVPRVFDADRVVLCAGVMSTPAVLMRSGVGPAAALRQLGIAVRLALEGVGAHLMEHPVVGLWGIPRPGVSRLGEPLRQTLLRCASGRPGAGDDLHLCTMSGIDARAMFPRLAAMEDTPCLAGLTACFNRPLARGRLRLASADPHAPPLVANNCLGHPYDVSALRDGVRLAWQLLHEPGLFSGFDRVLAWTDGMLRSQTALDQAMRSFVRPSAHGCGTARMGRRPEDGAVVDPGGRLHGADNVWVADASAIPVIPSAPPHLSCLMLAEKVADAIRAAR